MKVPNRPNLQYLTKVVGDTNTGLYAVKGSLWRHAVYALAEFPDGKIRSVRLNQQADSFFSWPGRTSYKKHTVTCWVEVSDDGKDRILGHYDTSSLQQYI